MNSHLPASALPTGDVRHPRDDDAGLGGPGAATRAVTGLDHRAAGAPLSLAGEPFRLESVVASLYAEPRLTPMLRTLLAHTSTLLEGMAGSISVVDPDGGTYTKIAERGVLCRLGATFPLDEGATGRAVARRSPVVIEEYAAITGRHLGPDNPASRGSVAAVPIWWRGEVVGVNVAFAGERRRFTTAQLDRAEVLSQTAAVAILGAGAGEPTLTRFADWRRRRRPGPPAPGADAGTGTRARSPLTAREAQVLAMVALGLADREIARRLGVSPKTVEKHVGSAIRKTGSASRTGAAVRGREHGWI